MQRYAPLNCISSFSRNEKLAVLLLNKAINDDSSDQVFKKLWHEAKLRACVDGGANFLFDMQQKCNNGGRYDKPNLICGDFDSIRPEVKDYFSTFNDIEMMETPNQDATDFTKCVKLIGEKLGSDLGIDHIVALSGIQNRFDHTMANISTLYRTPTLLPSGTRLSVMYDCSYVTLLHKGKTVLDVSTGQEGEWCGLIPVGHPAIVTATGLKWNLKNFKLEFGKIISTSNMLDGSGVVTVETDHPIIWTMSYKI